MYKIYMYNIYVCIIYIYMFSHTLRSMYIDLKSYITYIMRLVVSTSLLKDK